MKIKLTSLILSKTVLPLLQTQFCPTLAEARLVCLDNINFESGLRGLQ